MSMHPENSVLVVIPARGGSKGIPRKNLCRVGGDPLVARAVKTARAAELVTDVIVSTDDPEIAEVAERYGAGIVRRPVEISGDAASSESALLHALETTTRYAGTQAGIVVLMQCTAPFTLPSDVDSVVRPVLEQRAESAFAAASFQHFVWRVDDSGSAAGVNHAAGARVRRQDLEPEYLEAGSVYAMSVAALRRDGHRFCGRTCLVEIDSERCFEIDTPEELRRAQLLWPAVAPVSVQDRLPNPVHAVVFDFDGVFTDNSLYVNQDGVESVRCSRSDGMAVELLHEAGIPMLVISKERNPVVAARCRKLQIPVLQGVDEKRKALQTWLHERSLKAQNVVYVGNDVNDLTCLEYVGCAVGPADSHDSILGSLHIKLLTAGGDGVIRELADTILSRTPPAHPNLSSSDGPAV